MSRKAKAISVPCVSGSKWRSTRAKAAESPFHFVATGCIPKAGRARLKVAYSDAPLLGKSRFVCYNSRQSEKEDAMEKVISNLVKEFEKGALSRRELIQSLVAVTAAASTAAGFQETPFKSTRIDHISIQVTDLPRSIAFYQKIFGLSILNEDKANEIVRMGTTRTIVSLHHKPPTGIVDHYAIAIDGFDRESVTRALKQQGLTAEENLDYGFYVRDPEGIPVQIVRT
jgi:catechol 2,3-dioxygenase-like lactoylglutathione lyase family enzyme